ncbi:MAG: hypothetical protein WBL41_04985, partial [Terracidiphilus sp.]
MATFFGKALMQDKLVLPVHFYGKVVLLFSQIHAAFPDQLWALNLTRRIACAHSGLLMNVLQINPVRRFSAINTEMP